MRTLSASFSSPAPPPCMCVLCFFFCCPATPPTAYYAVSSPPISSCLPLSPSLFSRNFCHPPPPNNFFPASPIGRRPPFFPSLCLVLLYVIFWYPVALPPAFPTCAPWLFVLFLSIVLLLPLRTQSIFSSSVMPSPPPLRRSERHRN